MPKVLSFKVIVEQDESGVFVASVPAIPGCHTQGDTYEETVENVKEAIGVCLEEAKENKAYKDQITWPDNQDQSRFLGIVDLPIKIPSFA